MKNPNTVRVLFPVLLLATAAFAGPESRKEITIRRQAEGAPPHFKMKTDRDDDQMEMEKVAFLGIETMPVDPTVAAQLGLPRSTGLVVRRVSEGSPAAGVLQQHDVLTKLDDQTLINMQQLSVLVRNHKAGDEVKLVIMRGGKESTVKAKLGEREVPKMAMEDGRRGMPFFGNAGPGGDMMFQHGGMGFPGMGGPEAGEFMRRIGGDQMNWFAQPRVHVIRRHSGKGSTILDLPAGNFVLSDDQGSVEIANNEGQRELTVKNPKGEVTFHGPINTPEERKKLPAEIEARLDAIGAADMGDDDDALEVETKLLDPATKTMQRLPAPRDTAADLRTY